MSLQRLRIASLQHYCDIPQAVSGKGSVDVSFAGDNNSNAGENSAAKNDLYDAETTVSYDDTPRTQFPAIEDQSTFKQRIIDFVSGPTVTVDLVHSTTTPLPLAPIDYSDPSQVTAVLDLAACIGGLLLACDSGNRDTEL